MKLSISKLRQIIQEEFEAELLEKKKKKQQKGKKRAEKVAKRKKKKADKHFSPSQSPGAADKTFSDCIKSVKKSFKKHNYKPDPGDTVEDAGAKICTDSRKEGGATLDWGTSRECDVERKRPGGKTGEKGKCK